MNTHETNDAPAWNAIDAAHFFQDSLCLGRTSALQDRYPSQCPERVGSHHGRAAKDDREAAPRFRRRLILQRLFQRRFYTVAQVSQVACRCIPFRKFLIIEIGQKFLDLFTFDWSHRLKSVAQERHGLRRGSGNGMQSAVSLAGILAQVRPKSIELLAVEVATRLVLRPGSGR
jgi:hypothetical protein